MVRVSLRVMLRPRVKAKDRVRVELRFGIRREGGRGRE